MIPKIIDAHYVDNYIVWIKFDDGLEGEVDLKTELWGTIFEPLKNKEMFKRFRVDPELHTLVWENGADFSPEFLHSATKITA
ncbi:MAG: DUF2442 domain-containing protein [Ignavibacteriales bacterium]|nr:DUF2442 domain-containing protein [Ignavibacteriales bacterium]